MNTITLCTLFGGSHLYGLNTPSSDLDYRGVFMHTDPAYILGTKRFEEERKQNPSIQEDVVLKELNHFCALLKSANTEALEILFAPDASFTYISHLFQQFRNHALSFVDSEKLFGCLRGYAQGELRLALGERKGQIGGKRFEQVQKYGYSPKNFTQLFRLMFMGQTFFKTNRFIVNLKGCNIHGELLDLKLHPENYTKEELVERYNKAYAFMVDAFENSVRTKFDEDKLNALLLRAYIPFLK